MTDMGKIIVTQEQKEYLEKYLDNKSIDLAIKELEQGKPIQYVVGNVDFYNSVIKVNENVLIPRFETELLVDKLIRYIKNNFDNKINILDMCTGSGCIAISLKKAIDCNVDAIDISIDALKVAVDNAENNCVDVNFIESDLFVKVCGKYSVVVSNPPYISCSEEIMDVVKNNEPNIALYASDNGLFFYKQIISNVSKYLEDDFIVAFEIGMNQADDVFKIVNDNMSNVEIKVEKDYNDRDRFIFVFNKK